LAYPIEKKLVVAVSTTALFDLSEETRIFEKQGLEAFRKYQVSNRKLRPRPGAAFPFIKRFLAINENAIDQKPVEVVLLSRNHPDAGLRVMDAIKSYGLDITRANFMAGDSPYPYMPAFGAVLFLSTDKSEVASAVLAGYPAGYVLPCKANINDQDNQLRIAFDFDGVLADDESESVHTAGGLPLFHEYEDLNREKPLNAGPLMPLLQGLSRLQKIQKTGSNSGQSPIKVAIITARNAPAHERLITTLRSFDIETDNLFLTGGVEKKRYLDILKPHIFFDDQIGHLNPAAEQTPCVHIPFGTLNREAKDSEAKIATEAEPKHAAIKSRKKKSSSTQKSKKQAKLL
jgi:5'-nucleotidase